MACYVGIDVGAVSVTAAVLSSEGEVAPGEANLQSLTDKPGPLGRLYLSEYRRTRGRPVAAVAGMLEDILSAVGASQVAGLCLTGSGARLAAAKLDAAQINEFKALAGGHASLMENIDEGILHILGFLRGGSPSGNR